MIVSNCKTMAERFPDCDAKELQQFKENAETSNTKKSTKITCCCKPNQLRVTK